MSTPKIAVVSVHPKCGGWVRITAKSYMDEDPKTRKDFYNEVSKFNLSVKEIVVGSPEWNTHLESDRCTCKPKEML